MPKTELNDDGILNKKANELYKRLGGVGNPDARVVRALLERWAKEADNSFKLKSVIHGLHNDIGLAHDAAHERLKEIGIEIKG